MTLGNASGAVTPAARWFARLLIVLGLGLALLWQPVGAHAEPVAPGPNGELPAGWVNTQWGPLAPADRALVEGVRRADLWEGPAGQMAVRKGQNARVREIGATISRQHTQELDPTVLKVASQLGIPVPNQPNEQQQGWLAEMEQASGAEFDRVFVSRLRIAHGTVFALIASVRANTRNSLIREFAQTGNKYVDGHIGMLDSTGLVEFNTLPTPAVPNPAAANSNTSGGPEPMTVRLVLIAVTVVGGAVILQLARSR